MEYFLTFLTKEKWGEQLRDEAANNLYQLLTDLLNTYLPTHLFTFFHNLFGTQS